MLWRRRRVADRQRVQTQLLMLPELCKRQSVEHIVQVKSCIAQLGTASYMFSEVNRPTTATISRKIWGGQDHSGQAIKLKADRKSFSFSAPKMGYLVLFGLFRFRLKMNLLLCFIFRFRSKNVTCIGPKMLCSQWTVTKFCDRHRWLSFSAKWNIILVGIFVYGCTGVLPV